MPLPAPERRLAVVDLGSNTAKLVALAYVPGRGYRHLDQLRDVVRLSEGMGDGRVLRADAMDRALATLRTFRAYCDATGIEHVVATATSAVRDAVNGDAFLARVRDEAGFDLRVLSGEAEAAAGVLAVANAFREPDAVVLDLGGGSLQLSDMRARRSVAGTSWPLGAVRATEAWLPGDPPKKKHLRALRAAVQDAVGPWLDARTAAAEAEGRPGPRALPWIGMGGTLRSLAEAAQERTGYPLPLIHGYPFAADDLAALADDLAGMDAAARAGVPGLGADRADIVVAGATVLDEVRALAGAPHLLVSGYGLREGLFQPYLFPDAPDALAPDVRAFAVGNLAHRYDPDPDHSARVERLALAMFDALQATCDLRDGDRDLLSAAARLHDVGMAIDYFGHHRHGANLVMARALPGFTPREQVLIADLVRAHRKGKAQPSAAPALLEPGDAACLRACTAMLRLAEQLERSKAGRVRDLRLHVGPDVVQIEVHVAGDATLEVDAARARAGLLSDAVGRPVEIVPVEVAAPTPAGAA